MAKKTNNEVNLAAIGRFLMRGRKATTENGESESPSPTYIHAISQTQMWAPLLDEVEKEMLQDLIYSVAKFCDITVLAHSIMGNHFHTLVKVPAHQELMKRFDGPKGEKRFFEHLRAHYPKARVERLQQELTGLQREGQTKEAQKMMASYTNRMADVGWYMKQVKERISRWHNKRHGGRGALWEPRFLSREIQVGKGFPFEHLQVTAAFIDLAPVRAGLVDNPEKYRWCSYAAAMNGNTEARAGICALMRRKLGDWETKEVGAAYGKWLVRGSAVEEP